MPQGAGLPPYARGVSLDYFYTGVLIAAFAALAAWAGWVLVKLFR